MESSRSRRNLVWEALAPATCSGKPPGLLTQPLGWPFPKLETAQLDLRLPNVFRQPFSTKAAPHPVGSWASCKLSWTCDHGFGHSVS